LRLFLYTKATKKLSQDYRIVLASSILSIGRSVIRGIDTCPIHRRRFWNSTVRRQPKFYRSLAAEWSHFFPLEDPETAAESLVDLAGAAQRLLNFDPQWTTSELDSAWFGILGRAGFARYRHGDTSRLMKALNRKYGSHFLRLSDCSVGASNANSWVARFFRKPSCEADPLRHLLILQLFNRSLDDLLECIRLASSTAAAEARVIACHNQLRRLHDSCRPLSLWRSPSLR
jgi:hypothetical protein